MPKGPLGGPRPVAKSNVTVYTRIQMLGDIDAEDTEPLQTDPVFSRLLENHLENNIDLRFAEVRFHPAGRIVGIEVDTGLDNVGLNLVEDISGRSKRFVEDQLGSDSELRSESRTEEAVEVRCN